MTDRNLETPPLDWLIRVPPSFKEVEEPLFEALGCRPGRRLGREFQLVKPTRSEALLDEPSAGFLGWRMPVSHAWPCVPEKIPGFIEKAVQAMFQKFSASGVQSVVAGALDPSAPGRYYPRLASNLRGRALQVFGSGLIRDPEQQDPESPTLFALVGREGLFCGVQKPREAGGFHAGGFKFIKQDHTDHVSRAGAKIAEALHFLSLHRDLPPPGGHWLELGASPGGMTSELLARGYQVTAVDRAPLDPRLDGAKGLRVVLGDAKEFQATTMRQYDALLSDMNGDPADSMKTVTRFVGNLKPGAVVIFTVKMPTSGDFPAMLRGLEACTGMALESGLTKIATTHLGYNRHELTLLCESPPKAN